MIAGPDYVFLAIPRTASTAVQAWLIENAEGERLPGGHHRRTVPLEHRGKFNFTLVRNPAHRLYSLWCTSNPRGGRSFGEFVDLLVRMKTDRRAGSFGLGANNIWRTQSNFLAETAMDRILRFEDLPECLESLPFVDKKVELPVFNGQISKRPKRFFTEYEEAAVLTHSGEDFEKFEYSFPRTGT